MLSSRYLFTQPTSFLSSEGPAENAPCPHDYDVGPYERATVRTMATNMAPKTFIELRGGCEHNGAAEALALAGRRRTQWRGTILSLTFAHALIEAVAERICALFRPLH